MVAKKPKTKIEIANIIRIKGYEDGNGQSKLQVEHSPPYFIDFNNLLVGRIKKGNIIGIEYNGTIDQAIGCDELRKVCEASGLRYEEILSKKYRVGKRTIEAIREQGDRLVSIAERLEVLTK